MLLLLSLGAVGCRSRNSRVQPTPSVVGSAEDVKAAVQGEQVLLVGSFERVARAASGSAQIVRRGDSFELQLKGVSVAQEGVVRVYLVGHDYAKSTRILDETEMKYDMAELERGVPEQNIALPSEPDPALRSVVLFYPEFGVNLAVAPLRPSKRNR